MDAGGPRFPHIGTPDTAAAVKLAAHNDFCCYRSLLAPGALPVCQAALFQGKGGPSSRRQDALGCCRCGRRRGWSMHSPPPHSDAGTADVFRTAPYYIFLGLRFFETPDEIRMVVDAGPWANQSIVGARPIADALSFTPVIWGRLIPVDPGNLRLSHARVRGARYLFAHVGTQHSAGSMARTIHASGGHCFMWVRKAQTPAAIAGSAPQPGPVRWVARRLRPAAHPVIHGARFVFEQVSRGGS